MSRHARKSPAKGKRPKTSNVVVTRYRIFLENRNLAAGTINGRLAAVRRLAYEAADAGLLSPDWLRECIALGEVETRQFAAPKSATEQDRAIVPMRLQGRQRLGRSVWRVVWPGVVRRQPNRLHRYTLRP